MSDIPAGLREMVVKLAAQLCLGVINAHRYIADKPLMTTVLDYASRPVKQRQRILWLAHVLLVFPGLLAVVIWYFSSVLAGFFFNHLEHPATVQLAFELQWFWADRIDSMCGEALAFGFAIALGLTIASLIPRARGWLRSHVPFWYLAIPLYDCAFLILLVTPKFRN